MRWRRQELRGSEMRDGRTVPWSPRYALEPSAHNRQPKLISWSTVVGTMIRNVQKWHQAIIGFSCTYLPALGCTIVLSEKANLAAQRWPAERRTNTMLTTPCGPFLVAWDRDQPQGAAVEQWHGCREHGIEQQGPCLPRGGLSRLRFLIDEFWTFGNFKIKW